MIATDERSAGLLPSLETVDTLTSEGLVDVATQAAALHARAMARLAAGSPQGTTAVQPATDQYLDPADIAARLKVPKPHVYALIRSGELPGIAVGKYRRVALSDFRMWTARHAIDPLPYVAYETPREGKRRAPASEAPRPDAAPARRPRGGRGEQRREVGTRRDADPRVGGAPDAHAHAGELDDRP